MKREFSKTAPTEEQYLWFLKLTNCIQTIGITMQGNKTRLSVFGLGYVGCISAACFASEDHEVTGVDVNTTKVEIINSGKSPIVEPGVNELIERAVKEGRLRATSDSSEAVLQTDLSLVCVGTPSRPNGSLDLAHVTKVCEEIGAALKQKDRRHIVVIRSTMLPGTIENVVTPVLERSSGKKAGRDFGVCINPEFLREGSSVKDFYEPPFTLIGADDSSSAAAVRALYGNINAPVYETEVENCRDGQIRLQQFSCLGRLFCE
jgi:GDP-mannose 6-dehydrogenase